MKLWRLTVQDPDSSNWTASTYQGDVIARAENEQSARNLAREKFGISSEDSDPWGQNSVVACKQYPGTGGEYESIGGACILFPVNPDWSHKSQRLKRPLSIFMPSSVSGQSSINLPDASQKRQQRG